MCLFVAQKCKKDFEFPYIPVILLTFMSESYDFIR